MTSPPNECVVLVRRPEGRIEKDSFAVERRETAIVQPGEVLVRNIYLSCDPYLRLRMNDTAALGNVVVARVVGEVIASAAPSLAAGDVVWGFLGWERFSVVPAERLTKVDPALGPLSHAISVRGMIGLTAWTGMVSIGRPAPGDTVVVSAATGAVGSVAGQLARLAGARVVGIAGGAHKVRHAVQSLGYDDAIDYRSSQPLDEQLVRACPDGVDVYFDNVGGDVLGAVLGRLRPHARVAVCGSISQYEATTPQVGPDLHGMVGSRATMQWFSIYDHLAELPAFVERMAALVKDGKIVYFEDITEGFEHVIEAFIGLFDGDHLGKRLVRIGEEPS